MGYDSWAIKIDHVARWQFHRRDMEPGMLAFDAGHNVSHVAKALGPLAGAAEKRDHHEPEGPREQKRAADLIIHSIWLAQALGYDPAKIVTERILGFNDGFHGFAFDEPTPCKGCGGMLCRCRPPQPKTAGLLYGKPATAAEMSSFMTDQIGRDWKERSILGHEWVYHSSAKGNTLRVAGQIGQFGNDSLAFECAGDAPDSQPRVRSLSIAAVARLHADLGSWLEGRKS